MEKTTKPNRWNAMDGKWEFKAGNWRLVVGDHRIFVQRFGGWWTWRITHVGPEPVAYDHMTMRSRTTAMAAAEEALGRILSGTDISKITEVGDHRLTWSWRGPHEWAATCEDISLYVYDDRADGGWRWDLTQGGDALSASDQGYPAVQIAMEQAHAALVNRD